MRQKRPSAAVLLAVVLSWPLMAHAADDATAPKTEPPAATAKPPKAPPVKPKKPAADPADALITDAVAKLSAEYDMARKGGSLRTDADFFEGQPPAALTPEKVLGAIAKPVAKDPAQDAYVRWQLLSAIPGTIDDEKLAEKVLAIYRGAPRPMTRIATEFNNRKVVNRMVQDRSLPDAVAKAQFDDAIVKWTAYNVPIYAFRDALLLKAAPSSDLIIAGLADAADRYRAADPDAGSDQLSAVQQVTSSWAMNVKQPRQKLQVADAVERLRKAQPVEYAVAVETGRGNRYLRFSYTQPSRLQLDEILEAMRVSPVGGAADNSDKKGR
ncbi:MAG TPA: hypothetical protein VGN72_05240 [Tepidisphaeraceae bacterium]|jgi:hypothetical protein|nr:hypothetical protein [Tepidisphaeraceae bacterium]